MMTAEEDSNDIAMTEKSVILFVCNANRARSPAAEGLLRSMLSREASSNFEVSSAGLMTEGEIEDAEERKHIPRGIRRLGYGWPPDKGMIDAMLRRGIDISSHRSRKLTWEMAEGANLIITMEEKQKRRILSQFPSTEGKVFSLKELENGAEPSDIYDPVMSSPPGRMPYELIADDFEPCIAEMERCLREGLGRIIQ